MSSKQIVQQENECPQEELMKQFPPQLSTYTYNFCEENMYKLCEYAAKKHILKNSYVVFISNTSRKIPLWKQIKGRYKDKLIIWDYHAILLYHTKPERCLVYDFDSELPFPTYFEKYVAETFRSDDVLKSDFARYFRVIGASLFLRDFASDKRHKNDDDTCVSPPPDYEPISTLKCQQNLQMYIQMDKDMGPGCVYNLEKFIQRFRTDGCD